MAKIVFLVSSMHGGGAERVASLLCNFWSLNGHHVVLVPTYSGRGSCAYPLEKDVRLEFLSDRMGSTKRSVYNKIRRLFGIRQLIKEEEPDVVVSFLTDVNIAAILSTIGLPVRLIVSERSFPPKCPIPSYVRLLRKFLYTYADYVVMQSEEGLGWLRKESPKSNGCVIPNPVSYPLPDCEPHVSVEDFVQPGRKLILCVGRLGEEKRFDRVIKAFATTYLNHPDWDLFIVGEGRLRPDLEVLINSLGLSGRVFLPGRVGNLSEWYEKASIFVMSSHFEGFPNALIEAMAYEVPVISLNCSTGPSEIIDNGYDGILIPESNDCACLSAALNKLIDDDNFRISMGQRAIRVRERFSMEVVSGKWELLFGRST